MMKSTERRRRQPRLINYPPKSMTETFESRRASTPMSMSSQSSNAVYQKKELKRTLGYQPRNRRKAREVKSEITASLEQPFDRIDSNKSIETIPEENCSIPRQPKTKGRKKTNLSLHLDSRNSLTKLTDFKSARAIARTQRGSASPSLKMKKRIISTPSQVTSSPLKMAKPQSVFNQNTERLIPSKAHVPFTVQFMNTTMNSTENSVCSPGEIEPV